MELKITVMQMIDFAVTGEEHTSISGGRANHSFNQIGEFTATSYEQALKDIIVNYGTPFIFDDRLELKVSDSETLSFYIEEIIEVGALKLNKKFPTLETY